MKRSEINALMRKAVSFFQAQKFALPPFVFWTPEDWKNKNDEEYEELKSNMLGWDITDFGSGDFHKIGLLLITLRNGSMTNPKYPKTYCEKLMMQEEGQRTPYHFHFYKTEDIINRGGATLVIKLYNSNPDGSFADTDVMVSSDGRNYGVPAGSEIRLAPGESVTLLQGQYHTFWAEDGMVMITEVSQVNDDRIDNRFYEDIGRFPAIEEDEEPLYLLATDYETFLRESNHHN